MQRDTHITSRRPVSRDGIRAVTADDVEAFVASHFSPGNAVIVLVGDVSAAAAFDLAADVSSRRCQRQAESPEPRRSGL